MITPPFTTFKPDDVQSALVLAWENNSIFFDSVIEAEKILKEACYENYVHKSYFYYTHNDWYYVIDLETGLMVSWYKDICNNFFTNTENCSTGELLDLLDDILYNSIAE